MSSFFKTIPYLLAFCIFTSCQRPNSVHISGEMDYTGSAEMFISKKPVHYKYAPKIRFPVHPSDGHFSLSVPVDSLQVIELHIEEQSYALVAKPGGDLHLKIKRAAFPFSVEVEGYEQPYDSLLNSYLEQERTLLRKINEHLPAFRKGNASDVLSLYKKRYKIARTIFSGTPLESIALAAMGEYLVKRLEYIEYNLDDPGFEAEKERRHVIAEAKKLHFFSYKSLWSQRAGIRDFTDAYANTFGVAERIEKRLNRDLLYYDIKRIGYPILDSARTSVLRHITERRAKAYARMHLVAERIGEMPLEISTPSYERFLRDYPDFPRYTSFLKNFYEQIKKVSPGSPAVPFSLPDKTGEIVRMKDFQGKYVLLDFWAGWCIPCLNEFDDMKKIYKRYSGKGFEIVAISIEEDSLRWRQSLRRFSNPWVQLYGGNGFRQETFVAYRGGGIPFYILVGPRGKILRYNDIRPSYNLSSVLDSLINKKTNL